jgi:hypothetical protein
VSLAHALHLHCTCGRCITEGAEPNEKTPERWSVLSYLGHFIVVFELVKSAKADKRQFDIGDGHGGGR